MVKQKYSNITKQNLNKHGWELIKQMTVARHPLSNNLTQVFKFFSHTRYRNLNHVVLNIVTEKGTKITIEKNAIISVFLDQPPMDNQTEFTINNPPEISVNNLMKRTSLLMGKDYFEYEVRDNNCQDFLIAIFKANGISQEGLFEFVKQELDETFDANRPLEFIVDAVVDITGVIDEVAQEINIPLKL
jgi:hypothetical protein